MPSLLQDISNKQNVKKYQMRIICICPKSWAWQGVEKLNSKMASLRVLGEGSANALPRPVRVSTISTAKIFFTFEKILRFSVVALL